MKPNSESSLYGLFNEKKLGYHGLVQNTIIAKVIISNNEVALCASLHYWTPWWTGPSKIGGSKGWGLVQGHCHLGNIKGGERPNINQS